MRITVTACTLALAACVASASLARAQKGSVRESPHKRLERACEACHVATSFRDIRFAHEETGFALEGPHAVARCLVCHNVEDFSRVDRACASCHSDVHRGRSGPDCERCHTAGGWRVFDSEEIHASTSFPVMGRHLVLDCESCHPGMPEADFRRTPSDCIACHQADYDAVKSPDHAQSGFSTECRQCHQVTAWTPANMSDHDGFFPIFSGVHRNRWTDCGECHTSAGNYRVFDCLGCHTPGDTDPNHAGMPGYSYASTACLSCHPTGASSEYREHDAQFFPIYSGKHANKWTDCATCHEVATDKSVFTCFNCHDHSQARMDDKHLGEVQDYTYNSAECLRCHPDGRSEG